MPAIPAQPTQAQLEEMAKTAKPIEAYTTSASQISIVWGGNDAMLMFARPKPVTVPGHSQPAIAMIEATATIHVSAATLKDFFLIVKETVEGYEKDHGVIQTDFTRSKAQK
jgi:hypothetical protein